MYQHIDLIKIKIVKYAIRVSLLDTISIFLCMNSYCCTLESYKQRLYWATWDRPAHREGLAGEGKNESESNDVAAHLGIPLYRPAPHFSPK